jgi:transcriptional regulator with XRE-family HTH domain
MPLAPPGLLLLAQRLSDLREKCWPDVRITQAALADALGQEQSLSSATVSSWESLKSPKLPPAARLTAYARFFATRRSVESAPPRLLPLDELTRDERDAFEALEAELMALREGGKKSLARAEPVARRSWVFADQGPLTLVCAQLPQLEKGSLADPADPNYTELLSYADLDAMVELHGHVRAENPSMGVFFKLSSGVVPDDLSGHVVLVGGIAWNEMTGPLSAMTDIPIRQVEDPEIQTGEIFVLNGQEKNAEFLPKWGNTGQLVQDVGLLVRTPNPHNSNRSLTICNGVHSRGVLGSVRTLTDARLRDSNERYIAKNFSDPWNFAILMRVSVIAGQAMTPDLNAADCVLYQWP